LGVNRPSSAGPIRLANLRFTGPLTFRSLPPDGADPHSARTVLSFDDLGAWTSAQAGLSNDTAAKTEGTAALAVLAAGYSEIVSRTFATVGLQPTRSLALDVRVPTQQPNPYWFGDLQLFLTCPSAGIYSAPLGYNALTGLGTGAFHTLGFALPPAALTALATPRSDCSLSIALNVPAGAGAYVFDNLRFQ
jgi:hypothetical protein